ncbi:hypothetical protein SSP531S_36860 [Streptomyces spongiicola]|uniref:Uncharacterized protein n=1 Tax=Streptomyces spongiicola TaxID=1690221 RepID=A0A388T0D1_9ACTN|nr:hypothetical protein SSP531S_36860 [Streptomyces spongiicola]
MHLIQIEALARPVPLLRLLARGGCAGGRSGLRIECGGHTGKVLLRPLRPPLGGAAQVGRLRRQDGTACGQQQRGREETGAEDPGAERAGVERAGAEKAGAERAEDPGAEETGAKDPGADDPGA